MSQCPQCFRPLSPAVTSLICTGTCQPTHDEAASAVLGFGVMSRPPVGISAGGPGELPHGVCVACNMTTSTEACAHCHYEIPPMWRSSRVTTIAMAGARTTGKSLLVATALLQLGLLAEHQWRSMVEPLGTTAERFDDLYVTPLMIQRQLVPPTDVMDSAASAGREPLIFRFTERSNGEEIPRILVVKDVAGEDLEDPSRDRRQFSFFAHSDVVIVMVDPLRIPEIRAVLADIIPAPKQLGGDPLVVLNNVLAHMTGHVPGAKSAIPIGLVLSKFDVMQQLSRTASSRWRQIMSRAGSPLQRDPSLSGAVWDHQDGALLHEEVRALLSELGSSLVESILSERSERHQFFAVSALGASPDEKSVHPSGISPFRVLDPFKWALTFT